MKSLLNFIINSESLIDIMIIYRQVILFINN